VRHYNFLSLLNLKDIAKRLGPLKNYWEGSVRGEAIIATIKPEIKMGLRYNWSTSVLRKVMRLKSFHLIEQSISMKNITDNEVHTNGSNYKVYSCVRELQYELQQQKPISCITCNDKIYVMLKDKTLIQVR